MEFGATISVADQRAIENKMLIWLQNYCESHSLHLMKLSSETMATIC